MPIYEYESFRPEKGCPSCRRPFETLQGIRDAPLALCPECGQRVRKLMSRCRAAVIDYSEENAVIENRITEFERDRRWSHAAELADTQSSRIEDAGLKTRALDNYARAGYSPASLSENGPAEGCEEGE